MGERCDKYGFFNGIMGIEQTNWSNYWRGVVPDGVVAGISGEMEVTVDSGHQLFVNAGEAMVDNHKVWLTSRKQVVLEAALQTNPRIDLVIIRVVYGNKGQSYAEVDVVKGSGSLVKGKPVVPTLRKVTGGVYEYALASVYVPSLSQRNPNNLTDADITDMRYVFSGSSGAVSEFSEHRYNDDGTQAPKRDCSLTVVDGREYRLNNGPGVTNTITNTFVIELPEKPVSTFTCAVNYTTADEWVNANHQIVEANSTGSYEFAYQGITFNRGGVRYTDIKTQDSLSVVGVRYNIIIWWDGEFYWCAARAV